MESSSFLASVVGSLPRPRAVLDMLPPHPGEASVEAAKSERMDQAVAFAIALQEQAGLDVISDGEWRRHSYNQVIADLADGFVFDPSSGVDDVIVTEPLEAAHPGLLFTAASYLARSTNRMTKATIPSPYLIGRRSWHPERSARAYPTREAFMEALVPILRQELDELSRSGVDIVQIDEPDLGVLVDPAVRRDVDDWERELDVAVGLINELIDGISGVGLAMHLCRRRLGRAPWASGGYEPIVDALKRIKVDEYVLEFAVPEAGDVAILRELPGDRLIGLGCISPRVEEIDAPEQVVARVERALRYVEKGRISLNPDCGFAPGKVSEFSLDEAYLKLKAEAEAARRLREKYG